MKLTTIWLNYARYMRYVTTECIMTLKNKSMNTTEVGYPKRMLEAFSPTSVMTDLFFIHLAVHLQKAGAQLCLSPRTPFMWANS